MTDVEPHICLRITPNPGNTRSLEVLAHEGAHRKHANTHSQFSEEWVRHFPIVRPRYYQQQWWHPDIMPRNGLLNKYAAFDYNRDPAFETSTITRSDRCESRIISTIPVTLFREYSEQGLDDVAPMIQDAFGYIPPALLLDVKHIRIDPGLRVDGYASSTNPTFLSNKICEDVAVSTGRALAAVYQPSENTEVINMIHTHPKARGRVEMLADWAFIDAGSANQLLSANWREKQLARADASKR